MGTQKPLCWDSRGQWGVHKGCNGVHKSGMNFHLGGAEFWECLPHHFSHTGHIISSKLSFMGQPTPQADKSFLPAGLKRHFSTVDRFPFYRAAADRFPFYRAAADQTRPIFCNGFGGSDFRSGFENIILLYFPDPWTNPWDPKNNFARILG